jgi:glycosyltransferase involved in cell wall biosynthesis
MPRSPKETTVSLLIVCNVDWFFQLHIQSLALRALQEGYKVAVAAADSGRAGEISALGFDFYPLVFERSLMHFSDSSLHRQLKSLYQKLRPDLIHHFGLKLIWEGCCVANLLDIKNTVNSVTGMGYLYTVRSFWLLPVRFLFEQGLKRLLQRGEHRVIVQNSEDELGFDLLKICPPERRAMIYGAGVNLQQFVYKPEINSPVKTVLFPARMIAHKGLREFIQAARLLLKQQEHLPFKMRFVLAGNLDPLHRASLDTRQILELCDRPGIEWWGFVEDMPALFRSAHLVVMPSYREGCSKALMEACASGRAIVTTDVAGCRDVVRHNSNGLLVKPYAVDELAEAIMDLLLHKDKRECMGRWGREKAEQFFDEKSINDQILDQYQGKEGCKLKERWISDKKYEKDFLT